MNTSPAQRSLQIALRVARSPVWSEAATPFARTAGWYAGAWRRARRPVTDGSIPVIAPTFALAMQAGIDELVLAMMRSRHRPRAPEELARVAAEVATAVEQYEREGWLTNPASYHRDPPSPEGVRTRLVQAPWGRYEVVSFPSEYEPHDDEPGRERWLADRRNATAYAWVLRHPEPRPWLVCVHGAGMGHPAGDLRAFRAAWLHRELGLNVALPVQARHGPRREGAPFGVGFPGDDMMDNVHAIAQSVWDIRRVIAWARMQSDTAIGIHGISLGGYTTALVAGFDPDLACVIVGVPAVDFAELMDRHASARFRARPGYDAIGDLARRAHHVVSPLAIRPLVARERRFIYAGLADRLVHPVRQVQALWEHWERPEIAWFPGSHVGFFLSRPVIDFFVDALRTSGLVA